MSLPTLRTVLLRTNAVGEKAAAGAAKARRAAAESFMVDVVCEKKS